MPRPSVAARCCAADGGFLVVHAVELLAQPGAWVALKRTIETGVLEIGAAAAGLLGMPRPLEPDPIPIDVKVVMVGERQHYDALWNGRPRLPRAVRHPRRLLDRHADGRECPAALRGRRRGRLPARGACRPPRPARSARWSRTASPAPAAANRVSTRFGDTIRAGPRGRPRRGRRRSAATTSSGRWPRAPAREGLMEERMQLMLEEGIVLVSTSGEAVGRVNGLSVYDLGYHAFGKPTRITASAAPGPGRHHQRRARGAACRATSTTRAS